MKIILLGESLAVAWIQRILEELCVDSAAETIPEILVVEGPPTRELLTSLLGGPIDAVVLVDHIPFGTSQPADLPLGEAVRGEASRAILALELARCAVRTLVLARSDAGYWPASLAQFLAQLLSTPLAEGYAANLSGSADSPLALGSEAAGTLPATPLVSAYLAPLFAAVINPTLLKLVWPRESFLHGDAPGDILPATLDVAGRGRILAYGPYLPLPAGSWRATTFLGFSPDIGKMPFIVEVDTGGAIDRGFFEVERGGIFRVELDFRVADAMHPVELRLISQDSALEGQLALIEVELKQSLLE